MIAKYKVGDDVKFIRDVGAKLKGDSGRITHIEPPGGGRPYRLLSVKMLTGPNQGTTMSAQDKDLELLAAAPTPTQQYKVGDEAIINDPKYKTFGVGTHGLRVRIVHAPAGKSLTMILLEGPRKGDTQWGPAKLLSPANTVSGSMPPASKASGNSFPTNVVSGWTPHPPEEQKSEEGDDPHRGMVYNGYNKKWVWC